ncbi:MAG: hypothetical protein AAB225_31800 [Acidobacteriota bacterium]
MSVSPLEHFTERPFSFYPAILNITHNEWRLRRATWSEILVVNTDGDLELWIPRSYLGEISPVEDPVVIVGLTKELEYKAGTVWPAERQLVEMPRAASELPREVSRPPAAASAPVGGIRMESATESRIGRLIALALLIGVAAFVVTVTVFRVGPLRSRVVITARDQAYLELTRRDDYFGIVNKLGKPAEDRWRSMQGALQYRLLGYPERGYSAIMMGSDRKDARYIGAVDRNWRVLHYVELPGGGSTGALMRGLRRF